MHCTLEEEIRPLGRLATALLGLFCRALLFFPRDSFLPFLLRSSSLPSADWAIKCEGPSKRLSSQGTNPSKYGGERSSKKRVLQNGAVMKTLCSQSFSLSLLYYSTNCFVSLVVGGKLHQSRHLNLHRCKYCMLDGRFECIRAKLRNCFCRSCFVCL